MTFESNRRFFPEAEPPSRDGESSPLLTAQTKSDEAKAIPSGVVPPVVEIQTTNISSQDDSSDQEVKRLRQSIERLQNILGKIPKESLIRRAPHEGLLKRYRKELSELDSYGVQDTGISLSNNNGKEITKGGEKKGGFSGEVQNEPGAGRFSIVPPEPPEPPQPSSELPEEPSGGKKKSVPQGLNVEGIVSHLNTKYVSQKENNPRTGFGSEDVAKYLNERRIPHEESNVSPNVLGEKMVEYFDVSKMSFERTTQPQEKQGTPNQEPQEQQPQKEATSPDAKKPAAEVNQPENKPAPETKETKRTPVDPWVERYLAAQFNIRKEDIENIEGFGELTVPQQKSICENLAQLTLGSVQEEAARSVSRAVGMRKSEMVKNYGRFLGGVLAGAREALMGRYNAFTGEKDVAKEMRTGGIQKHGQLLTELVQNMRAYGPRIHENAQGELVVDLVNIRERARDKSTRDAEWFAMNELNAVAHEFAKTPSDWRGQTLGVDTRRSGGVMRFFKEKVLRTSGVVQEGAYAKREEAYARAKQNLENILQKKGEDERSIADTLLALDTRVYQMQTLSTNPNAMEELAQIKDKSFFVESAKSFFSGPGAYMALGTVGRTLGGAALGFLGAPVVAGAMSSLRSWNRTAAELRERDRNARVGIKDTKGGSLNVVSAERAEQTVMVNGAPVPNGLTAKLNRLLSSIEHAEGEEKKKLLAQLRARIEYTHDKQRLHRIDYGATEGRVTRQAELAKALAKGLVYLSMEDEAKSADVKQRTEKVQGRLAQNLSRTEKMIIEARMKGRRSDLLKSAGVAASFSIAGALLAQLFNGDSVSGMGPHESSTAAGTSPETVAGGAGTPVVAEHAVSPEAVSSAHAAATETMAPALETHAPYTVQRGDSLWKILSHETALKDLGETRARENAVGNILKLLTPAQLQEVGITSGDVRIIHPGDVIDMEKVSEVLNQHKDIIESARSRFGYLPINADPKDIIPH